MQMLRIATLTAIVSLISFPANAQTLVGLCRRVQDPDGWVNVRDRVSGEVVGTFANGTEFYITQAVAAPQGYAAIAETNGDLMVHTSRLVVAPDTGCDTHYFI